jgi:hypothetical protein
MLWDKKFNKNSNFAAILIFGAMLNFSACRILKKKDQTQFLAAILNSGAILFFGT